MFSSQIFHAVHAVSHRHHFNFVLFCKILRQVAVHISDQLKGLFHNTVPLFRMVASIYIHYIRFQKPNQSKEKEIGSYYKKRIAFWAIRL